MQRLQHDHLRYRQTFFSIQKNNKRRIRANFFDFDLWTLEESDKVGNYRFLENRLIKFGKKSLKGPRDMEFPTFSDPQIFFNSD